jgi:hypothetical protein
MPHLGKGAHLNVNTGYQAMGHDLTGGGVAQQKREHLMLSKQEIRIENARLYPAAIVDELRTALSNGAKLQADETRRNFFDLDIEGRTYFIYVSPDSGSVTLIASWARERPSIEAKSGGQAPWWRRITAHIHAS